MPIANIPLVRLGAASGTQRTVIDTETARTLREANLLVEESHRVRPRWFDGKFLAARDLTREQAYFLARQAGFARGLLALAHDVRRFGVRFWRGRGAWVF